MSRTYEFEQTEREPNDITQKVIIASETITEIKKNNFTLNDKKIELLNAKAEIEKAKEQVKQAEIKVTELEKEISDIKTALNIKDETVDTAPIVT